MNNEKRMQLNKVSFNQPYVSPYTFSSVSEVLKSNNLSGNGPLTKACEEHIQTEIDCARALLTTSCTAALMRGAEGQARADDFCCFVYTNIIFDFPTRL